MPFHASRKPSITGIVAFLLFLVVGSTGRTDDVPIFELPQRYAFVQQQRLVFHNLLVQKKYTMAEQAARKILDVLPDDPVNHYNLGCAEARLGRTEAAIADLQNAVELGFRGVQIMLRDDDLTSLHQHAQWNDLLKKASEPPRKMSRQIKPRIIENRVGLIEEDNTFFDPRTGLFRVFMRRNPEDIERLRNQPIAKGLGRTGDLLRQWQENGTAAGLTNVLYHNNDKYHSRMKDSQFPQLSRVEYGEAARKAGHGNGLQDLFLFNGIVLGNSSTALTNSPLWRCLTRYALVDGRRALHVAAQYANNHLYVYPEHRDYDPGHNGKTDGKGYGDVFPMNTPWVVTTQGSSGSDRIFLQALAASLAAMRPEVQKKLATTRTLMPALQMILRRSYGPVKSDGDYLAGKAHPVVFDGKLLDEEAMVNLAHSITEDRLPPVAQLKIVKEDDFRVGVDYFDVAPREKLFTTTSAIARVARAVGQERSIHLSAQPSGDLNGYNLTYHWVLLQGDPQLVTIEQLNDGKEAKIAIQHHPRRPVQPGSNMDTNRVDIGLIVYNGHFFSAPAFLTYYFPDNETRKYDSDGRVQSVTWTDPAKGGNYIDPMIVTAADWTDEFHWKGDTLTGWTRTRGTKSQRFAADGARVLTTDDQDRPLTGQPVRYVIVPRKKNTSRLGEEPVGKPYSYEYSGDDDFVGQAMAPIAEPQVP